MDDSNIYNTYNEESLKLINKNNKGDFKITGNFKVAGVQFLSGYNTSKIYDFALFDDSISVNSTIVCDTVNGFTIGKVVSIRDKNNNDVKYVTKKIIGSINMTEFEERKANRAKAVKLKNLMNNRIKELQDTALFEMMAEKDDALKSMLSEYKSIVG